MDSLDVSLFVSPSLVNAGSDVDAMSNLVSAEGFSVADDICEDIATDLCESTLGLQDDLCVSGPLADQSPVSIPKFGDDDDGYRVESVLENFFPDTMDDHLHSIDVDDCSSHIDDIHGLWRIACGYQDEETDSKSAVNVAPASSSSSLGLREVGEVRIEGCVPVQAVAHTPHLTRRQRVERYLIKRRGRKASLPSVKKPKSPTQRRRSTFVRPRVNGRFTDAREFVRLADLE